MHNFTFSIVLKVQLWNIGYSIALKRRDQKLDKIKNSHWGPLSLYVLTIA